MQTIFKTTISGFDIELEQTPSGKFWVTYGKQQTGCDYYDHAALELGRCILHASACAGLLVDEDSED
jgi:hypothetical protein